MSVHRRESILRRKPTDRRSFIARAMGLSEIGDIASGGMSKTTAVTLTWETSTDWDNNTSQLNVVHESVANTDHNDASIIKIGYPFTSFYTLSVTPHAYYPLHEDSGSTANDVYGTYDGTINSATLNATGLWNGSSYSFDGSTGDVDLPDFGIFDQDFTISWWMNPNTGSPGDDQYIWSITGETEVHARFNENGNNYIKYQTYDGSSEKNIVSGTIQNGTWNHIVFTYDQSANEKEMFVNGSSIGTQSHTLATLNATNALGNRANAAYYKGDLCHFSVFNTDMGSSEVSDLYIPNNSPSLTTATKSFGSSATPDLQNLSYSLNGQSIDLDVIGSPGTASEEVVTQTLDGATSYSLTWSNSHTDFRVRPKPSTTDVTVSPTVSRIELVG